MHAGSNAELICSLAYAPPEVVQARVVNDARRFVAHENIDMWAIGVIMWELLLGRRWHEGVPPNDALRMVQTPGALPWESRDPRVSQLDKLGISKRPVLQVRCTQCTRVSSSCMVH